MCVMEKQFNRSMAKEISQKVQEALNEMFKTGEFEYLINGGSFTADKLTLKWSDGRSSKAGMLFLLGGVQLVEPTLTEFTKWLRASVYGA